MSKSRKWFKYILKIIFTGPECSGKTTLSAAISSVLGFPLVKEVAREYLEIRNNVYQKSSLHEIGLLQLWEENCATLHDKHICCDTDILTVIIWQLEKYKMIDSFFVQKWINNAASMYFLCKPDMAWVYDSQRENPLDRDRLFEQYRTFLELYNKPYIILSGSLDSRIEKALHEIHKII